MEMNTAVCPTYLLPARLGPPQIPLVGISSHIYDGRSWNTVRGDTYVIQISTGARMDIGMVDPLIHKDLFTIR